ncbi:MAG: UbiA family prenyltransferase [Candidatus Thorarchaeota archaeon]
MSRYPDIIAGLRDIVRLSHCVLASIGGFCSALIAATLNDPDMSVWDLMADHILELIFGIWVPFLLMGGAMAINDYRDYEIDKINQRLDRPLVRGDLTPRQVLVIATILYGLGIVLTAWLFLEVLLLTLFFVILSISYSYKLKELGFIGNISIALSICAPFVLGAIVVDVSDQDAQITIGLLITSIFFLISGREVMKGIMDVEGDKEAGVKTIAAIYGVKPAAFIATGFWSMVVILAPLPMFFAYKDNLVYFIIMLATVLMLLNVCIRLLRDQSYQTGKYAREFSKVILWTGLMAYFLGALSWSLF